MADAKQLKGLPSQHSRKGKKIQLNSKRASPAPIFRLMEKPQSGKNARPGSLQINLYLSRILRESTGYSTTRGVYSSLDEPATPGSQYILE